MLVLMQILMVAGGGSGRGPRLRPRLTWTTSQSLRRQLAHPNSATAAVNSSSSSSSSFLHYKPVSSPPSHSPLLPHPSPALPSRYPFHSSTAVRFNSSSIAATTLSMTIASDLLRQQHPQRQQFQQPKRRQRLRQQYQQHFYFRNNNIDS